MTKKLAVLVFYVLCNAVNRRAADSILPLNDDVDNILKNRQNQSIIRKNSLDFAVVGFTVAISRSTSRQDVNTQSSCSSSLVMFASLFRSKLVDDDPRGDDELTSHHRRRHGASGRVLRNEQLESSGSVSSTCHSWPNAFASSMRFPPSRPIM
jgi:hypothetical protein